MHVFSADDPFSGHDPTQTSRWCISLYLVKFKFYVTTKLLGVDRAGNVFCLVFNNYTFCVHSGRRLLGLLTRFFSDSVKRRPFRLRTVITGIGDSLVLRAPQSLSRGLGFESQLEWRGDFYSLLSTFCAVLTFWDAWCTQNVR